MTIINLQKKKKLKERMKELLKESLFSQTQKIENVLSQLDFYGIGDIFIPKMKCLYMYYITVSKNWLCNIYINHLYSWDLKRCSNCVQIVNGILN